MADLNEGEEQMSSDVAAIEKVLQVYFDGLHEGDTRKLGEVQDGRKP